MLNIIGIFAGKWNFTREISDPLITIQGEAIFKVLKNGDRKYIEQASWGLHDKQYTSQQINYYQISNTTLQILRKDKSLLHEFEINHFDNFPITLEHIHKCKNDLYRVRLEIADNHNFKLYYNIKGPQKNYNIATEYRRL